MTPRLPSLDTHVATSPSAATRPAREAAFDCPFLSSTSTALSMSPAASTSAFLQSLIPAWVRSRSSLTIPAVISAMTCVPVGKWRLALLGSGHAASARPVPAVVAARAAAADDLGLRPVGAARLRLLTAGELLAALRALDGRVADARGDELDRPDRVVV